MAWFVKSIGKTIFGGDIFDAIESYDERTAFKLMESTGFAANQINPDTGKTLLQTALGKLSYTISKENENRSNKIIYKIINELLQKYLVVGKADIDEINNKQLMIIIFLDNEFDIFKYFLKKGADPNVIYKGNTNNDSLFFIISQRLSVLSKHGVNSFEQGVNVSKIMDIMLENGADPNVANISGEMPLTQIIDMHYFQGNKEYRKYWIEKLVDSTQTVDQLVKPFLYLLKVHTTKHNSGYYVEYFLKKGGRDLITKCYAENILVLSNIMNSFDGALTQNKKSLEVMKPLINYGANVDELNRAGYTLLQSLLDTQQLRKAMWLLQHGADPNLPRPDGKTPIMYAVETENLDCVKLLLEQYPFAENDSDTAILSADIIHKIDMSRTDKNILLVAAEKNNNSDIVELLMNAGVDLEYEDSHEMSALDIAVYYGNSLVCETLLQNGFNANKQSSIHKETALFIAAQNNNNNNNADILLQILIRYGGDPDLPNSDGDTPLMVAASKKPEDKTATDKEIVKLLIEYEADIEHKNNTGKSALDVATKDIKPTIKKAMKTMENRRNDIFDSSRIEVDENREVIDPIEGTETLLKDYLLLDPNNKVLIIGNFTLGINSEVYLEQFKKRTYRYDNKYYECNNVQDRWPSRDDIIWSTGAMLNLRAVGGPGGLVDFDIFIGLLNSPDRLFELREMRQIPAIAGLQMLHHAPGASSSEHCQGGTVYKYYKILKIGEENGRSSTESKTKRVRTVSGKYKTRETLSGGKKTRRRQRSKR